MNVILTGDKGQLGTVLRQMFEARGDAVAGLDIEEDITKPLNFIEYDTPIGVLVNCAGVDSDQSIEVNLKGTVNCIEAYLRTKPRRGCIINIASIYGLLSPNPQVSKSSMMYGATKAAIIQLTKYYAVHYGPNVRVNCVSPGGILKDHDKEFLDKYEAICPMRRMADVEDIANGVMYLTTARYTTGHNLVIDGGLSCL